MSLTESRAERRVLSMDRCNRLLVALDGAVGLQDDVHVVFHLLHLLDTVLTLLFDGTRIRHAVCGESIKMKGRVRGLKEGQELDQQLVAGKRKNNT